MGKNFKAWKFLGKKTILTILVYRELQVSRSETNNLWDGMDVFLSFSEERNTVNNGLWFQEKWNSWRKSGIQGGHFETGLFTNFASIWVSPWREAYCPRREHRGQARPLITPSLLECSKGGGGRWELEQVKAKAKSVWWGEVAEGNGGDEGWTLELDNRKVNRSVLSEGLKNWVWRELM